MYKIWQRLEERFGYPELIEQSVKQRIAEFAKITFKEYKRLYQLCDLLSEIASLKNDPKFSAQFSYFDTSAGIIPVIQKLPAYL